MVRRVHTASALLPVVPQLHVLNSWHISRFPGHMSIASRVDHVLTKETFGNRCSAVIWSISTSCLLISLRITFTPHCHDFYERDSQHYKLMEWKNRSVCRYAQTARHCHTRRVHSSIHTSAPTRRVPFASTENTSRCGLSVPDERDAVDAVCTRETRRVPLANGTCVG